MRPLGILGGTFDPIHYGHLRPAREALDALGLEAIHFIPCAVPPHRSVPVASAAQRLRMVQLAVEEFPRFRADDCEIRRGGPSYTVLTLESLRAAHGDRPLCLLVGLDAFLGFETWHRWRDIPALAHLVVLTRPGWMMPGLPAWAGERLCTDGKRLAQSAAGQLFFLSVNPQNISGSGIRAALAAGEPIEGLVPEAVRQFICQNHIYSHLTLRA